MKSIYIVMAILASVTIVTIVTMSAQQVYAPRNCGSCAQFQKLTNEFEIKVLNASLGSPEEITELVDKYSANVKALFASPSPTP
ncbi:MAG TPA: hypothetical protein VJS91_06935 [Nitrososphaeraceae archaeon]|nr:hypothetical protein [Nitrososphaeraceae archaeon]